VSIPLSWIKIYTNILTNFKINNNNFAYNLLAEILKISFRPYRAFNWGKFIFLFYTIMQPNEQENIYTDDVDYANTSYNSVWGTEDKATADLLEKTHVAGKWLNLCAGDGRFNNQLLEKADELIAVDIDENALQKIVRITPETLRKKLIVQTANVVKPFPFVNDEFDGIFCVGTLHLFPKLIFKCILDEMGRVLKSGGRIIIDFATDIKRIYPDGSLWIVETEPNYTLEEALIFLKEMFKDYEVSITTDKVEPEKVSLNDKEYVFTSKFILLDAIKK
jgi:SAM-dependent methyltransferase